MSKSMPDDSILDRVVELASSLVRASYLKLATDFPPGFAEGAPLALDTEKKQDGINF